MQRPRRSLTKSLLLAGCLLFAAGCSLVGLPENLPVTPSAPVQETHPVVETEASADRSVAGGAPEPAPVAADPSTPTPEPIRFEFPAQNPLPESAWRPPLYPVPWAPTENDHFYFIRPIAANEIN